MCAMLSKYWPSGYFSVMLNGLLVPPNCKVQKIHFTDFFFGYRDCITTYAIQKKNKITKKIVSKDLRGKETSNCVISSS